MSSPEDKGERGFGRRSTRKSQELAHRPPLPGANWAEGAPPSPSGSPGETVYGRRSLEIEKARTPKGHPKSPRSGGPAGLERFSQDMSISDVGTSTVASPAAKDKKRGFFSKMFGSKKSTKEDLTPDTDTTKGNDMTDRNKRGHTTQLDSHPSIKTPTAQSPSPGSKPPTSPMSTAQGVRTPPRSPGLPVNPEILVGSGTMIDRVGSRKMSRNGSKSSLSTPQSGSNSRHNLSTEGHVSIVHGIGHMPQKASRSPTQSTSRMELAASGNHTLGDSSNQLNVITGAIGRQGAGGPQHGLAGTQHGLAGPQHGLQMGHSLTGGKGMDFRWASTPAHTRAGAASGSSHSTHRTNLQRPNQLSGLHAAVGASQAMSPQNAGSRSVKSRTGPIVPPMPGGDAPGDAKKFSENILILRLVAKYLTVEDACRGSCVNKQFQNLSKCMESVDLSSMCESFRSFEPIGRIHHLRALRLKGLNLQPVKDIDQLAKCKFLQRLDLSESKVTTAHLAALSGCTRLAYLNLQDSGVTDIAPIGRLVNLTKLILRDNPLSNVSALGHCSNLIYLDLHNTKVKDLSVLAHHRYALKNLQHLDLRQCECLAPDTDFSTFKNLKNLNLFGTKVDDISSLASCYKLTVLNLWFTPVKSIMPIASCVSILHLDLANTQVDSLVPLAGCNKLRHLSLWSCPIKEIDVLRQLPNLKRLDLTETRITSIAPLKGCKRLTSLHMWAAPITSISALKHCKQLVNLDIADTKVEDISPLQHCTLCDTFSIELRWLCIRDTAVSDISALENCSNLEVLDISGTKVSDLSALAFCPLLSQLDIRETQVTLEDNLAASPKLRKAIEDFEGDTRASQERRGSDAARSSRFGLVGMGDD